jgi:hypothetical protein
MKHNDQQTKLSPESQVAEATDAFLEALARGEAPEVGEYAGHYPEVAANAVCTFTPCNSSKEKLLQKLSTSCARV